MKPRYSFVGKKHKLVIDPDIWTSTLQYVKDQLAIMKRHGSEPDPPLTDEEHNDLVYDIARHPQEIRNLRNGTIRATGERIEKPYNAEVSGTGTIQQTPESD